MMMNMPNIKMWWDNDWLAIENTDTKETIVEGKNLQAEDILYALGFRFEIEDIDRDDYLLGRR